MGKIKHFSAFLVLLLASSCLAFGQSSNGYLVGGVGWQTGNGRNDTVGQVAGGGEWVAWKSLGVGAEAGAILGDNSFGTVSFNGYYHFPPVDREKKLDPFVTAGYTLGIEFFDTGNLFNFGFGANYWMSRHFGLRGEFRDLIPSSGNHIWGFRFGIALH